MHVTEHEDSHFRHAVGEFTRLHRTSSDNTRPAKSDLDAENHRIGWQTLSMARASKGITKSFIDTIGILPRIR
jgi:hypothetical protein